MHSFGIASVGVLPTEVVVTIAPRVEHIVLLIVSLNIPGWVGVTVGIFRLWGTVSVASAECAKKSVGPLFRLDLEAVDMIEQLGCVVTLYLLRATWPQARS